MLKIQKLDFLISLYIACIAVSELMSAKTFPLFTISGFSVHASIGIFVVPVIYTINDIMTEVFGKARAQSLVRSGLLMVLFFLLFSILATSLPPSVIFAHSENAYESVFSVSARIAASSLVAFAIGEFLDVIIFTKIRQKLGKKSLWLRTNASNFISEFFDTALFLTLAFYAPQLPVMANISFLLSLILPYWLLKCIMSVIETPFVYLGAKWLKKSQ
jgi:uncharacterized integral membrane protein (TIGR00697 family)